MRPVRCVQNFNHRRALIVSENFRALDRLGDSLSRLGMSVLHLAPENGEVVMDKDNLQTERDVLFLDGDLGIKVDVPRYPGLDLSMIPVVGMVGIEAPSRLGRLFSYGATAFIKKPVHAGTVFFSLFMAVNEYNQQLAWNLNLLEQNQRRRQRRYVIKAVLLLMKWHGLTDEGAYEWLRQQSMCAQTSVEEFAKQLVEQAARQPQAMQPGRGAMVGQENALSITI